MTLLMLFKIDAVYISQGRGEYVWMSFMNGHLWAFPNKHKVAKSNPPFPRNLISSMHHAASDEIRGACNVGSDV